jgi:hydrogenase maturation factor HypE
MNREEEELQKVRARHLREQLAQLKSGKTAGETGSGSRGSGGESPLAFIRRRMREIASSQQTHKSSKENQQ